MNATGIQPDGDSVRIKYSTLSLLAPFISVLLVLVGGISSYSIFKQDIANLVQANVEMKSLIIQSQSRENALHDAVIADRISDSNRLIAIEGDIKRMVQDVAEIKAFPRRQ